MEDRIEIKPGIGGFEVPVSADMKAPPASMDRRTPNRKVDRFCMKAERLEVMTDGTLAGTVVLVDGVQLGGLVRFEMVAAKGYKRVTAVVDMNYDRENIPEYGEFAGQEERSDSGAPAVITADVFKRG